MVVAVGEVGMVAGNEQASKRDSCQDEFMLERWLGEPAFDAWKR